MYGAPPCQRPQQAADQCCATCGLMLVSALAALSLPHPTGHACRRCTQRGWAGPPAVACSLTQLPMGFCKAHATPLPTPDNYGNSLNRKVHGPRGSAEGRPRVNMAVLMGSQLPACWHVPPRLTACIAMATRDATVAEHSLAVQQCGGWWRRAREGRRVSSRQWGVGHASGSPLQAREIAKSSAS